MVRFRANCPPAACLQLASLPAAAAVLSAAVRSGAGPVAQLMRAGGLYCVFQPLADLRSGSIYAHEALIRGPRGMPLHTPDALLKGAAAEGILREFELLAVCVALQDWGRQGAPGRLFVNLSAQALVQAVGVCGSVRPQAAQSTEAQSAA